MENTNYINHQIIADFLQSEDSLTTLWRAEILERPLDLSFKDVSDIPESIVHKLKHFSTVVLSNTRISKFPKALIDFTHIITLDMSRCNMKELSPAIGNLVSLKYLILDHNQLTFLPETIGKLTNLLELNVAYNNLRELPGTYGFLASLKYLNISHNELPALPTEIGKLQNLETIIATHNQIREVNPSIGSMSKLWSINLRYNPLERVPSTLIKIIPRLTMMDFDNTPLYDHVFNSEENKNKFASVAEYLFSLPADIIVSISTFTRDMRNILNSSTFSDMKFKHGDKIYNGHRSVVSARLHRVRSDLLWNEANIIDAMKTKDCIITIKDSVPANIFEAVLAYLYVADVTDFEAIKGYVTDTPRGSEAEQMLAKDLAALRKSGDFSDVSFTVESEEVKGHKCILAATCKTLSTFFTGEWKEARENTANLGGFSHEAVELFFEYLYTGDCEVTGENVMEMLAIADVFHVDRLKEQCERLLVDGLDEDNLMLIYEAAERHSAHQLIENCAYYASRNCPPETFSNLPEKLYKIAEGLKERTKELKNQLAVISSKGSIVHKTEEERIKIAQFHWDPEAELKSSAEWGKLKGYNIKDPSEVLPSGKEETEKFLEQVMEKLKEPTKPTKQRSKRVKFEGPSKEIDRVRSSDDEAPFELVYTTGDELTDNARAFMGRAGSVFNRNGPFVLETQPNMNVLTRAGNVILTDVHDQVETPIAPSISLNDNPFQAKFGQDNDEGKGLSKSPQKSPRGLNFGGGITFNAYNGETQPSTSPSTSPGGFNFSFDNASPSKTGSTTNPSKSLFTDGLAFGITKPPETISFTNDTAESGNGKQNTNPFAPVFAGGETFNFDASNNSHTSTSPVTSSNGFGFTFGGPTLSQNEANTDSSNINTFGFSFSTSPSQHGLSANTARTRSPHKSGRKSPKRDLESNEGIFGDNEKEKSMEHLITRLNFNE